MPLHQRIITRERAKNESHFVKLHSPRRGSHFQGTFSTVLPLEARTFEKKQIFQEEQKTIFAIIKPVLDIFF